MLKAHSSAHPNPPHIPRSPFPSLSPPWQPGTTGRCASISGAHACYRPTACLPACAPPQNVEQHLQRLGAVHVEGCGAYEDHHMFSLEEVTAAIRCRVGCPGGWGARGCWGDGVCAGRMWAEGLGTSAIKRGHPWLQLPPGGWWCPRPLRPHLRMRQGAAPGELQRPPGGLATWRFTGLLPPHPHPQTPTPIPHPQACGGLAAQRAVQARLPSHDRKGLCATDRPV